MLSGSLQAYGLYGMYCVVAKREYGCLNKIFEMYYGLASPNSHSY